MGAETRTQIITGLADFVKENREDQLGAHASLYNEILYQWRALNGFSVAWVNQDSQQLADTYWTQMAKWYDRFVKEQGRIINSEVMPTDEMWLFYVDMIEELADGVVANLPAPAQTTVTHLNDFALLINYELRRFRQLDLYKMTPIDCMLLIEYWKAINVMVKTYDKD